MNEKLEEVKTYFKNHIFKTVLENEQVKIYEFNNPKNGNLSQTWILRNNVLIVHGDAYDSIYVGGSFDSLESIAECNVGYFSSKCKSDKDGLDQSVFDSDECTENIHELIFNYFEDNVELSKEMTLEEKLTKIEDYIEKKQNVHRPSIPRYFDDEYEAVIWIRENNELVGQDWWDGFKMKKKNMNPFFHLAAIKVAVDQMKTL